MIGCVRPEGHSAVSSFELGPEREDLEGEVARLQAALRRTAQRAADRQQEVEGLRTKAEEIGRREAALAEREQALVRAESMWERVLEERSAKLEASLQAVEERERRISEREDT